MTQVTEDNAIRVHFVIEDRTVAIPLEDSCEDSDEECRFSLSWSRK